MRNNCVDGLERTWPEEKRLIEEKSRNNRWTGAERQSKKQAGRTTTINRQEKSTWNLTPPYIWIAYNSNIVSYKTVRFIMRLLGVFKCTVRSVYGTLQKLILTPTVSIPLFNTFPMSIINCDTCDP